MRAVLFALSVMLVVGCASPERRLAGASKLAVMELPRPNSGRFSFEEAGARKEEIYDLTPSGMLADFDFPYGGFSLHITAEDGILQYGGTMHRSGMQGRPYPVTMLDVNVMLTLGGMSSNPTGVLITSEREPRDSATLLKLMDLLFTPPVQLFYLRAEDPPG